MEISIFSCLLRMHCQWVAILTPGDDASGGGWGGGAPLAPPPSWQQLPIGGGGGRGVAVTTSSVGPLDTKGEGGEAPRCWTDPQEPSADSRAFPVSGAGFKVHAVSDHQRETPPLLRLQPSSVHEPAIHNIYIYRNIQTDPLRINMSLALRDIQQNICEYIHMYTIPSVIRLLHVKFRTIRAAGGWRPLSVCTQARLGRTGTSKNVACSQVVFLYKTSFQSLSLKKETCYEYFD